MAYPLPPFFSVSDKKPTQSAQRRSEQWEQAVAASTLPTELIIAMGGEKHRLPAAQRRKVIDVLVKMKMGEDQNIPPQDLEDQPTPQEKNNQDNVKNNDAILSDVALSGILRSKNITPTAPRLTMMKILFQRKTHQHITAEEIFAKFKKGKKSTKKSAISLASIYNCLNLFTEQGLLARHYFSFLAMDKKSNAVFYDTNIMPHHHVIDKLSGKIYDLPLDIIKLHQVVDTTEKKMKEDNIIPKNLWRASGRKKNISVMPMVFVLE